ncbi:MAG TPA: gamma-glutamylcyclotransferase [Sandaracinaceae bacterium LLY-WYZ-13_1]|nr:gamma-glutamylcyclotransferase [Sandaracinaceae bacterium LLY-WYZ-13_1]
MLYFGYGSNLHRADFARWCRERGHRTDAVRALGPAFLPDAEPVFHYRSKARGGGAMSVRERPGHAVPGVLFEVDEEGWGALDRKEGRPRYYERVRKIVLTADGEERSATTYEVTPPHRRAHHVPPTEHYARLVTEGLAAHGLPHHQARAAARGFSLPSLPEGVFVYGTLMRGERAHARIRRHGPRRITRARTAGRLVSFGGYPGMLACEAGGAVHGELVSFEDAADALAELDPFEDFYGYGAHGSEYRRVVVEVATEDGRRALAWAYRYVAETDGAPPIPHGDWRRR